MEADLYASHTICYMRRDSSARLELQVIFCEFHGPIVHSTIVVSL